MNGQVFRSGKPVTARGIVSAVIAGDVSPDEAVDMIDWLVDVRARGADMQDTRPERAVRPTPGAGSRSARRQT